MPRIATEHAHVEALVKASRFRVCSLKVGISIAAIDVFMVATNTGTGSPMIDKYNGQLTLENMRKDRRPKCKKV